MPIFRLIWVFSMTCICRIWTTPCNNTSAPNSSLAEVTARWLCGLPIYSAAKAAGQRVREVEDAQHNNRVTVIAAGVAVGAPGTGYPAGRYFHSGQSGTAGGNDHYALALSIGHRPNTGAGETLSEPLVAAALGFALRLNSQNTPLLLIALNGNTDHKSTR